MNLTFIIFASTILIIVLIICAIIILSNKQLNNINNAGYYKKLFFLRKSELKFLEQIDALEKEYAIVPKLSLRRIIKTDNKQNKKELKRITVDYAIFDKKYCQVLLLIELSYQSEDKNNQNKIAKLKRICDEAGIKFITFTIKSDEVSDAEIITKIRKIIKENI